MTAFAALLVVGGILLLIPVEPRSGRVPPPQAASEQPPPVVEIPAPRSSAVAPLTVSAGTTDAADDEAEILLAPRRP